MNSTILALAALIPILTAAYLSLRKDSRDAAIAAREAAKEVREDFKASAEKVAQVHTIVNANYDRVTNERDEAQLQVLALKEENARLRAEREDPSAAGLEGSSGQD